MKICERGKLSCKESLCQLCTEREGVGAREEGKRGNEREKYRWWTIEKEKREDWP